MVLTAVGTRHGFVASAPGGVGGSGGVVEPAATATSPAAKQRVVKPPHWACRLKVVLKRLMARKSFVCLSCFLNLDGPLGHGSRMDVQILCSFEGYA